MRRGRLDVLVGGWLERHEELPTGRHAGGHNHINVSTGLGILIIGGTYQQPTQVGTVVP